MQKKSAHKAAQLWKPRTTRRASLEERAQRGAHPGKRAQRGATLEAAHSEVRIIKKGPRVRKGEAMLQIHTNRFKNTYRLFDLQGTIMPSAKEAEWLICVCLHKYGSSGSPGPGTTSMRIT